ncbi:MAG: hypothetical protein P0116_04685 [Candidatus Nitrosocosmicus sp.]|nr:hypothetical protein [Candidatus Nitrosocosmicus sp.]
MNSDKLGKEYENDMFVVTLIMVIYMEFTLNEARDDIVINNTNVGGEAAVEDKKVDNPVESIPITFGQGFGGITDIQVGPDGYMYVLKHTGDLYRYYLPHRSAHTKNSIYIIAI